MTGSAGRTRYTAVAIALHWIIAAVIATNFGLGLYMAQLEASPAKLRLYSYHKTIGVTIFLLVVFRLVWRLTHRVPAPPPRMPKWQRTAASVSHILLYLLTLAVPLSRRGRAYLAAHRRVRARVTARERYKAGKPKRATCILRRGNRRGRRATAPVRRSAAGGHGHARTSPHNEPQVRLRTFRAAG